MEIHWGQMCLDALKMTKCYYYMTGNKAKAKNKNKGEKKSIQRFHHLKILLMPTGKQLFIWRRIKQAAMAGFQ